MNARLRFVLPALAGERQRGAGTGRSLRCVAWKVQDVVAVLKGDWCNHQSVRPSVLSTSARCAYAFRCFSALLVPDLELERERDRAGLAGWIGFG